MSAGILVRLRTVTGAIASNRETSCAGVRSIRSATWVADSAASSGPPLRFW